MRDFNRDDRSGSGRDFGRRDSGRGGFGGRGGQDRGRREMHKAICANCGKECEVPFEPTDGRPVYCSECFEKKDGSPQAPRNFHGRDSHDRGPRRPDFERRDGPRPQNNEQIDAINRKLDKILEMLSTVSVKEEKGTINEPKEVETTDQKKIKVSKKKSPVKK